jgi:hypothetical protein
VRIMFLVCIIWCVILSSFNSFMSPCYISFYLGVDISRVRVFIYNLTVDKTRTKGGGRYEVSLLWMEPQPMMTNTYSDEYLYF